MWQIENKYLLCTNKSVKLQQTPVYLLNTHTQQSLRTVSYAIDYFNNKSTETLTYKLSNQRSIYHSPPTSIIMNNGSIPDRSIDVLVAECIVLWKSCGDC